MVAATHVQVEVIWYQLLQQHPHHSCPPPSVRVSACVGASGTGGREGGEGGKEGVGREEEEKGRRTEAAAEANEGARAVVTHEAAAKAGVECLDQLPRVLPEQEADSGHVPRRHTNHLYLALEIKTLMHVARRPQSKAKRPG